MTSLKLHSTVETRATEPTQLKEPSEPFEQPSEYVATRDEGAISKESISEHERITQLAYSYWQGRGCPEGSAEEDWLRAEQSIQLSKLAQKVGRETSSLAIEETLKSA